MSASLPLGGFRDAQTCQFLTSRGLSPRWSQCRLHDAAAQRRAWCTTLHTRVVVGVGVRYGYPGYGYPFYGFPFYSSAYFYDPFWWGFAGYQFRATRIHPTDTAGTTTRQRIFESR